MKTTLAVLISVYAVTVFGVEPSHPTTCPDGSSGHSCGKDGCRPGYYRFRGQCCKEPNNNCPSGDIGAECSDYNPCKPGYDCLGDRCCRKQVTCSSGIDGPACSKNKPCQHEHTCKGGRCCAVCPRGRKEDGPCNWTPGEPFCKPEFDCINNLCCDVRKKGCPFHIHPAPCPRIPARHECFNDDNCKEGELCCYDRCRNRRCTNRLDD